MAGWIENGDIYPLPFPVGFILLHLIDAKVNFNFGAGKEKYLFERGRWETTYSRGLTCMIRAKCALPEKCFLEQKVLAKENRLGYKPNLCYEMPR